MKDYFNLQFRMLHRRFKDAGLHPFAAYLILTALFIAVSVLLFQKTEYAGYIYILTSLAITGKFSEAKRNEFLKICFPESVYMRIRIIENLLIITPSLLFLLYKELYISMLVLGFLAVLFAAVSYRTSLNFTIPTPFYRKPFEFTVGFRNTYYLFPVAYSLTCISIATGNFNLGVFSLLFIFLITLTFYSKPENEYYVWTYKLNSNQFLLEKIKTALLYSSLCALPVVSILGFFFPENIIHLALFLLAGYAFLICMITAKYVTYPGEVGLAQGILIAIALYFPPLLIILVPYFFIRSASRLKELLR